MSFFKRLSFLTALIIISGNAFAASRATKKIGLGIGFLSDPFPTVMSYQLKYNATPWLQIMGGYGTISTTTVTTSAKLTSMGIGAKGFLVPSWNLSPYVSGNMTFAKATGDVTLGDQTISGSSSSRNVYTVGIGVDHQANIGFNFGAGINYVLAPSDIKAVLSTVTHAYVGWFF